MERFLFDQLAGEAVRELLQAVRGAFLCRSTGERLRRNVEPLLPLVQNHHAGHRSAGELADLAAQVIEALDLARRAAAAPRWNVYLTTQLARRMEAADRGIARWLASHAPALVFVGVRRLRDEAEARMGRLERRVEEVAAAAAAQTAPLPPAMSVPVGLPPPPKAMAMEVPPKAMGMEVPPKAMAMAMEVPPKAMGMAMDVALPEEEGEGVVGGGGVKVGKEMVMSGGGGWEVVGISGMGGSGKTTLAMEIFRDHKVRDTGSYDARGGGPRSTVIASGENGQSRKRKRTRTSSVWQSFTKIVGHDPDGVNVILAVCNHCCKAQRGESKYGISHLARHRCLSNH